MEAVDRRSPFVSVIVPVLNGLDMAPKLLDALFRQTYPKDRLEIIVVDNGSSDGTSEYIEQRMSEFDGRLKLVIEMEKRGSYAARNKGISASIGDVIAFTDADCTPVPGWLEAGVAALVDGSADLVGGKVTFTFSSPNPSAAEIVDSRINMQMERDIVQRNVTKTANLFTWKRVVDAVGPFDSALLSGGDVLWTGKATTKGFRLIYCPQAEVQHPARGWKELFVKQMRVGKGQIPVLRQRGLSWLEILVDSLFPRRARPKRENSPKEMQARPTIHPVRYFVARLWARGGTLIGRLRALVER